MSDLRPKPISNQAVYLTRRLPSLLVGYALNHSDIETLDQHPDDEATRTLLIIQALLGAYCGQWAMTPLLAAGQDGVSMLEEVRAGHYQAAIDKAFQFAGREGYLWRWHGEEMGS